MKANSSSQSDIERGQGNAKAIAQNAYKTGEKVAKEAAKKTGKAVAEGAAKSGAAKGIAGILAAGLSSQTLLVIVIVLILVAIPVMLISAFPIGDLFQTNTQLEAKENELSDSIYNAYSNEALTAKKQIRKYVNSNYSCSAGLSDISYDSGTIVVDTDTCYIKANIIPPLSEMQTNISAYINAVNGTIAYFGEKTDAEVTAYENGTHEKVDVYEGRIFEKNSNGSVTLTSDAKEFYDSHSDELTNTGSDYYIASAQVYASNFFVYDEDEDRWDINGFHVAPKTHEEYQIVGYEKNTVQGVEVETPVWGWVDVTCDAWYGDINILMFYDLSGYKAEDLAKCVEIMNGKNSSIDAYLDATSVVSAVLNEYYANYIGQFKGHYDSSGNFVLGEDNRNELFAKLIEDGTLMYVPISGLSSNFLLGSPGYSGSVRWNGYIDQASIDIWRHINSLRKSGVIGYRTAMWNCTAFAQAWFYELYGVNALYGNGRDMVSNLLDPNNELVGDWGSKNFYLGSSPAPGGIFSISSPMGANHVGCVDEVDYEAKIITFSDGNTNGAADYTSTISIRRSLTFEQFESYVRSCCSHHGSTAGCSVTYANPNK